MPNDDKFAGVQIVGLADFRRDVGRLSRDYRKALDKELRAVARPIAAKAKVKYRRQHGRGRNRSKTRRKARASRGTSRSIRAGYRRGRPFVELNGDRSPWLNGQEWGSTYSRRDKLGRPLYRFPRRTRKGYFFWMTAVAGMGDAMGKILRAVDRANRRAFPDGQGVGLRRD